MTGFIILLVAVVIISYLKYRSYEKEKEEEQQQEEIEETMEKEEMKTEETSVRTRDLLIDIFKKWGCQYELDEDGVRIYVYYQGGTFYVDAVNGHSMINIYHPSWMSCDLSDIDNFSRLRKLVNEVNLISGGDTILYTIDEEEERMTLHSFWRILFIQQIPGIEDYLRAMLGSFFRTRQKFHEMLAKEKALEEVKNEK